MFLGSMRIRIGSSSLPSLVQVAPASDRLEQAGLRRIERARGQIDDRGVARIDRDALRECTAEGPPRRADVFPRSDREQGAPAGRPGPFGVVHFEATAPGSVPTIAVPPMPAAPPLPAPPAVPAEPPVPLPVPIGPLPRSSLAELPPFADDPAVSPTLIGLPALPELFPAIAPGSSMSLVGPDSSAPALHPTSNIAKNPLAYRMKERLPRRPIHTVAFDAFCCIASRCPRAAKP